METVADAPATNDEYGKSDRPCVNCVVVFTLTLYKEIRSPPIPTILIDVKACATDHILFNGIPVVVPDPTK